MKYRKEGLAPDTVDKVPESNLEYFNKNIDDLQTFSRLIDAKVIGEDGEPVINPEIKKVMQEHPEIKTMMQNYTMIRLKSLFEFHLKEFLIEIIDDRDLDVKGEDVLKEDTITLRLDLLDKMQKANDNNTRHYSKGRIICAHLNNIPPGKLFKIFSKLNEVDFGPWFKKLMIKMTGKESDDDLFDYFDVMHEERNDIIHNLKDTSLSTEELQKDIHGVAVLLEKMLQFTKINLHLKQKNLTYVRERLGKLGITEKDFVEITNDFHEKRSI